MHVVLGAALLALMTAAACIVNTDELPCRADCQCPEAQFCISGTCKQTSKPTLPPEGSLAGPCATDGTCGVNLVCVENICGQKFCRGQCVPGATGTCGADEICELPPGDAGAAGGVCTP